MTKAKMNLWSRCGLGAYYYATLLQRIRRSAERAEAGQAPIMVLFYHRIADSHPNDWTMPVAEFRSQLRWLQEHFDLISLNTAQERIRRGTNYRPAVSITFDDGYADNCDTALPLLIQHRVPVTYFVSSEFVLEKKPFPHDLAAGEPLAPNTVEQLRALAAAGVEIGAHTRSHADLGSALGEERLREELLGGRDDLQEIIGQPIRYFAFPYGLHENLSQAAFGLAQRAGFAGVCSAYGGYNHPGDDAFHLQRIHADPQRIRLKNWLTVDPRKEKRVERFTYECEEEPSASGDDALLVPPLDNFNAGIEVPIR